MSEKNQTKRSAEPSGREKIRKDGDISETMSAVAAALESFDNQGHSEESAGSGESISNSESKND